jgi:NADPH2 dehydrogenase
LRWPPFSLQQSVSNSRTDEYGGSVENRARFLLEIIDALVAAVGAERVGFRLSPFSTFQGQKMKTLEEIHETFGYVVKQVKERHPNLAYVHAVEGRVAGINDISDVEEENLDFLVRFLSFCLFLSLPSEFRCWRSPFLQREIWAPRPFFVAGGFTLETGPEVAAKHENIVMCVDLLFLSPASLSLLTSPSSLSQRLRSLLHFVRLPSIPWRLGNWLFLLLSSNSNPDLVHRIKNKIPFTPYDRSTFYLLGNEPRGYTDYPFAGDVKKEENKL